MIRRQRVLNGWTAGVAGILAFLLVGLLVGPNLGLSERFSATGAAFLTFVIWVGFAYSRVGEPPIQGFDTDWRGDLVYRFHAGDPFYRLLDLDPSLRLPVRVRAAAVLGISASIAAYISSTAGRPYPRPWGLLAISPLVALYVTVAIVVRRRRRKADAPRDS